jgi:hypothetical protein
MWGIYWILSDYWFLKDSAPWFYLLFIMYYLKDKENKQDRYAIQNLVAVL